MERTLKIAGYVGLVIVNFTATVLLIASVYIAWSLWDFIIWLIIISLAWLGIYYYTHWFDALR